MPRPTPASRRLMHSRDVILRGYVRDDGLIDIEARMTDLKPYSWSNDDRGQISAGDPLHDMWMRVTIGADMVIRDVEAQMDSTPHTICPQIAPNFKKLIGLSMTKGFMKSALGLMGGVNGCTHLRELLQPIATVAFQTMFSISHQERRNAPPGTPTERGVPRFLLNSCHAYAEDGELAQRVADPA